MTDLTTPLETRIVEQLKNKKLKAYFVHGKDSEYGVAIVHYTAKEAKRYAWLNVCLDYLGVDNYGYIDLRVKLNKKAILKGITKPRAYTPWDHGEEAYARRMYSGYDDEEEEKLEKMGKQWWKDHPEGV